MKDKTEYSEMLEFILTLQERALSESDRLLSNKKELEYKKKQQEFLIEEHQKKKIPNISMFSPLNTEDSYENDVAWKDELQEITEQLELAEQEWQEQQSLCTSFERLKRFLLNSYCYAAKEESEAKEASGKVSDYSAKLLETQEMDRNRISRDLHDSTVQGLTSLVHKTEFCSKMVDKDPVRVKLELQSMIDLNKDIINDMREIIYDLRPMSLNNIGLVSTLESYCLHLRRKDNQDVILMVEGEELSLSSIINVTLYRIIQEACNNAMHHSLAKKIWIRLYYMEQSIKVEIEDNGVGFDLASVEEQAGEEMLHFGLSTMRERARLLGGSFELITKPGAGTKIQVVVPVNPMGRNGE